MTQKREKTLANSAKEIAQMEKSYVGRCGALIAFVIMMNAAMAFGQSHDAATADASFHAEMIPAVKDTSVACSRFVRSGYQSEGDISERRPSINGVMVVEDMRCRQCRGKCKAEDLRCRSQCVGESACLAQCEERSSKCETMCKQVFQCE